MQNGSQRQTIHNQDELEFAVFCIESVAEETGQTGVRIYNDFTRETDTLNGYIIPCYDILHTQGRGYVVEDILDYARMKGAKL